MTSGTCCNFVPVAAAELPVFRRDCHDYTLFYTPGYMCLVSPQHVDRFAHLLEQNRIGATDEVAAQVVILRRQANAASEAHRQLSPYRPVCLTLYLHNRCNLRCIYCFSAASPYRPEILDLDAVHAAAKLVAANCADRQQPLYLGLHGGGEPSLHRFVADQALSAVEEAAKSFAVPVHRYIATNGVFDTPTAEWLVRNFDQIGVSCDGPPEIQNVQRPNWAGADTARQVAKTASYLRQRGVDFHIRATITSATARRQIELVKYFCEVFAPRAIHFEPVYCGGRAKHKISVDRVVSPSEFVGQFLEARRVAKQHGTQLVFAGTRVCEIHGPYCHVLRDVLNLLPGGGATACFKYTTTEQAAAQNLVIGKFEQESNRFVLDEAHIIRLRSAAGTVPAICHTCFNRFHCAYGCPDTCLINNPSPDPFRCQVQKLLAAAFLTELAQAFWHKGAITEENITITAIH